MAKKNIIKRLAKGLVKRSYSFDQLGLKEEGFPLAMVKTFLQTADKLDCIITSRTPGGPAGGLIYDGHDLKGYEIKSKSCTWGPMAGFLCKLPPLNKYGAGKIEYNYKYLSGYYNKWTKKDRSYADLFQPIKISDKRKNEIFRDEHNFFKLGKEGTDYIELSDDLIYGICESGSKTKEVDKIKLEYLLKKDEDFKIWHVYHGAIQYKDKGKKKEYTGKEEDAFFGLGVNDLKVINVVKVAEGISINFSETNSEKISNLRAVKGLNNKIKIAFSPVEGAINPYPPYPKIPAGKFKRDKVVSSDYPIINPKYYKNCVTGDYDLFACWPRLTRPLQELIREAELKLNTNLKNLPGKYFQAFGKSLTVALCPADVFNHIYVEFIPGLPIINQLEIPNKGNINDLTELVAGTLNSISGMTLKNSQVFINKAFHNDEGGRPKIDDIEFPVAYFMPKNLVQKLKTQETPFAKRYHEKEGGLLENINDFLYLIKACTENGYRITLSHGWIIFMVSHALSEDEFHEIIKSKPIEEKATEYYEKTIKVKREECRENVLKYLFGYFKEGHHYKAKDQFLLKVAEIFLPFLNMNEEDTTAIIGKVDTAKSLVFEESDFEEYKL